MAVPYTKDLKLLKEWLSKHTVKEPKKLQLIREKQSIDGNVKMKQMVKIINYFKEAFMTLL